MSEGQDQADEATIYAINLARVSTGMQADAVKVLKAVEKDIVGKLVAEGGDFTPKGKRYKRLLTAVDKTIKTGYSKIQNDQSSGLREIAKIEAKQATKLLNKQIGVDIAQPLASPEQLEAVVDEAVVLGNSSKQWWDKQDKSTRDEFRRQMQIGAVAGESVEQLAERVKGVNGLAGKSQKQAEALVRSSVQSVSNAARLKSFEASSDIVKGIKWISTLDGRTTHICISLDGLQWRLPDYKPVKHGKAFPGPTAHFNCRSTQIAVPRGWDELSKKKLATLGKQDIEKAIRKRLKEDGKDEAFINQAVKTTRASMDGQVDADQDFEQWASKKSPEFLKKKLGAGRWELYNSGKISLRQLTDQKARPLTVAQLANMVETGKDEPDEGVEFLGISQKELDEIAAVGSSAVVLAGVNAFKALSPEHEKAYSDLVDAGKLNVEEDSLPEALEKLEAKLDSIYITEVVNLKFSSPHKDKIFTPELTQGKDWTKLSSKEKLDIVKAEEQKHETLAQAEKATQALAEAVDSTPWVSDALDDLIAKTDVDTAKKVVAAEMDKKGASISNTVAASATEKELEKQKYALEIQLGIMKSKFGGDFDPSDINKHIAKANKHIEAIGKIADYESAVPQSVAGKAWAAVKKSKADDYLTPSQKLDALDYQKGLAVAANKKVATISSAKKAMVKKGVTDIDAYEGTEAWKKLKQDLDSSELADITADVKAKLEAQAVPKVAKELDEEVKNLDHQVPDVATMKVIKSLPGSTSPDLMEDTLGKKWVVKSKGTFVEHRENESAIDNVYRAAGAASPFSTMQNGNKVAEFIDGGTALSNLGTKDFAEAKKQLRKHFALDALLDNWDVAGLTGDNVLYAQGKAWRIDNGGAGKYRAQGQSKPFKGNDITSFDTLRDPTTNQWGAKVFKGITQKEIRAQLAEIDANKDKIFSGLPDSDREVLLSRLELAKKKYKVPEVTDKEKEISDNFSSAFTPKDVENIKAARSNGYAIRAGFQNIEDAQVLAWEEFDVDGTPLTMMDFKLTPKGQDEFMKAMEPTLAKAGGFSSTPDKSKQLIEFEGNGVTSEKLVNMAKTLHTHASDKAYNPHTVSNFNELKQSFDQAKQSGQMGLKGEALDHYQKLFDDLSATLEGKQPKPTVQVSSYIVPPEKGGDEPVGKDFNVQRLVRFENKLKSYKNGVGTRTGSTEDFQTTSSFLISNGDVKVRITPSVKEAYEDNSIGREFRVANIANANRITLEVRGSASEESVAKAVETLSQMGVDLTPPSKEQKEYVYQRLLLNRALPQTEAQRAKLAKIDEAALTGDFKPIEKAMKSRFGKDYKKHQNYNPEGKTIGSFGHGHRVFERIDVEESDYKDRLLTHSTSDQVDFIKNVLAQGGIFTPTTGRQRKGIQISGKGASPETDLNTGGADFSFTRMIKRWTKNDRYQLIYFKPEALKRVDALSYTQDSWGAQNHQTRKSRVKSKPEQWDDITRGDNETLFKNGLDMIGDVEEIRADGSSRDKIIKAYKDAGLAVLPDGRKIENVVIKT